MEKQRKKKLWSIGAVAILVVATIIVLSTNSSPILANPEKNSSTANEDRTKNVPRSKERQGESDENKSATRRLNPIENENGVKATAKVLTLAKDAAFPDLATTDGQSQLFSEMTLPDPESGASYEYVTAEGSPVSPESGNAGFQMIYVRITENADSSSIIVPIPVTITNSGTTLLETNGVAIQVDDTDGKILLYSKDTQDKTETELKQLVQTKGNARAWYLETGNAISVNVLSTTIDEKTVGAYTATFEVTIGAGAEEQKATTSIPVMVFGVDLKAPYYATVVQNSVLNIGTDATNLFGKYPTLTAVSDSATYEWVADETGKATVPANRFNSSKSGFQMGYIKMTDKENGAISTVIPIPVTVTNATERTVLVSSKAGLRLNVPFLPLSKIKGKAGAQLLSQLTESLSPKAWSLTTGDPLKAAVTSSELTAVDQKGQVTVTVTSGTESLSYNLDVSVFPDGVFEGDTEGWQEIPLNSSIGQLINPTNRSRVGFPGRGVPAILGTTTGYRLLDKDGNSFYIGNGIADIPGIVRNNNIYVPLYGSQWSGATALNGSDPKNNNTFKEQYYLRKGNTLRQILVDTDKKIMYVYNISLQPDLSFGIRLDMYNLGDKPEKFTMLQSMGTSYDRDRLRASIYSTGGSRGFYVALDKKPDPNYTVWFRLKDSEGKWLTQSTKYYAGTRQAIGYDSGLNYFNNNNTGFETKNYIAGYEYVGPFVGPTGYQIGTTNGLSISPGQALKTGFDLFYGSEELSAMKMQATPNVFNSYPEHTENFETDYTLSDIPAVSGGGTIYTTYPDKSEGKIPFTSNAAKKITGHLTIPRTLLPEKLNEEPGTIKSYDTNLKATYETAGAMKGISSSDYKVKVNIYNLGAQPIRQVISAGSVWDKTASSLIKDPVILPGHTAKFEYLNPDYPIYTGDPGTVFVYVLMTDADDPSQKAIIKVPVVIVKGTVPTNGLLISAYDISLTTTEATEIANLPIEQQNEVFLKKSEAMAWDVETGSQEGVELSVLSTNFPKQPQFGTRYFAVIQAKKGTTIVKASFSINIFGVVAAKFIDTNGNELHDDVILVKELGSTVDLTKESEITDVLAQLKKENHELVKKPDNEVVVTLASDNPENIVTYQFDGALTIISAPDVLDFETQKATINAVKFTDPKVTGKPLVVSDTRTEKEEWTLKAKVDQPLTSLANKEVIIPDAIKYNYQGEDWTLGEDTVVIVNHKNTGSGIYDVTKERWSKGEGFLLDLRPGAVKALGKYQAKITITLENTK